MKSQGITFTLCSEEEASRYLAQGNSYFRTRSYRTNFAKREGGKFDGQYANLDFAMLKDLANIDLRLRNVLLPMTLDIEHFAKLKLLAAIEESNEDGYSVVADFLATYQQEKDEHITNPAIKEIERGRNSPYTQGLIQHRPNHDYPVWEYIEVIPFGSFMHFYKFCAERLNSRSMVDDFYLMQTAKSIRNACAHNNCILNDLQAGIPKHKANNKLNEALAQSGIGARARSSKLSNERLQQIATTLYVHSIWSTNGLHLRRTHELQHFKQRALSHSAYYSPDSPVTTGIAFIVAMIDAWYPSE